MLLFKAFVSKETKKYNYIIKANSETEAKDKLHSEGYSILSLKKIEKIEDS
jgi:type II secretory pathway component PulF